MQHAGGTHPPGPYAAALERLAARHGLADEQTAALDAYVRLVLGWRRGNVTGLTDAVAVVDTLLGDSLSLLAVPQLRERESAGWLDLGAGAGIPGIPLAVALPAAELTLLDSVSRKCAFLEEAVAASGLAGRARVVCARSERCASVGAPGREAHGVVLARAVAELPVLVELAAPLLAEGGVLLASKTRRALDEEGPRAEAAALRCALAAESPVDLPASPLDDAVCAVYRKTGATPDGIPRREGMAAKRPFGA
jgi:16S rRNA (guanine527-N7)-methyltransferase